MSGYHIWCNDNARSCGSGCCTLAGDCATSQGQCFAQYIDYSYPDLTGKYTYPGYYNLLCNAQSRNCGSGCCKSNGDCAASSGECVYEYADYRTPMKYSYGGSAVTATISVGPIAGGIIGGVVALIVIIGLICWYKKSNSENASECQEAQNNEGTNVIVIQNPHDSSNGMVQPLYNPNMNSPPAMYTQNTQQIYTQPVYQPGYVQPVYGNKGQGPMIIRT